MVFYTADIYLNSREKLTSLNRQFDSISEMNRFIISAWNHRVQPNDDVYILGGVGSYEMSKRLNGLKHLILSPKDYDAFEVWCVSKNLDPGNVEHNSEMYETFLRREYSICSVNFFGKLARRTNGSNIIRLLTSKKDMQPDFFSLVGSIGKMEKFFMLDGCAGLNVSLDVHGFQPVSEIEMDWYIAQHTVRTDSTPISNKPKVGTIVPLS